MSPVKPALGVLAGLAIALVVVACGGGKAYQSVKPVNDTGGMPVMVPDHTSGDPHRRIEVLSDDITASLQQMSVPQPQPWDVESGSVDPRPMATIETVCVPPTHPPGACADVCTLSTHICDSAAEICRLADDLQPDDWSKGKCEDGKKSCESGRQKCCDCT